MESAAGSSGKNNGRGYDEKAIRQPSMESAAGTMENNTMAEDSSKNNLTARSGKRNRNNGKSRLINLKNSLTARNGKRSRNNGKNRLKR